MKDEFEEKLKRLWRLHIDNLHKDRTTPISRQELHENIDIIVGATIQQAKEERDKEIAEMIESKKLIKISNEGGVDFMIREAGNAIIDDIINQLSNTK